MTAVSGTPTSAESSSPSTWCGTLESMWRFGNEWGVGVPGA